MKKYVFTIFGIGGLLFSCKEDSSVSPFETPVSCVKEYLDAKDSSDVKRMMNCYSYESRHERILREFLEGQVQK